MEDRIKIAEAIAPVILQHELSSGRNVIDDGEFITMEIKTFTNKLLAKLYNVG